MSATAFRRHFPVSCRLIPPKPAFSYIMSDFAPHFRIFYGICLTITLPDYIAAVLDDVALMTKAAAKKTAGVAGDDLTPNANRVTGVSAERELPIVWPVAKGSFANKPVLVSAALLLSAFLPQLITPLLTAGGIYLCFEGVEKLLHKFLHRHDAHDDGGETAVNEQAKIKGAIRTDFILSAEIIIIALCVVEQYSLMTRSLVMAAIGIGMTVLVYGIVAVIVKLDDLGMLLMRRPQPRPFARFPARATLERWLDRVFRQPRCRAAFRFDCLRPALSLMNRFGRH